MAIDPTVNTGGKPKASWEKSSDQEAAQKSASQAKADFQNLAGQFGPPRTTPSTIDLSAARSQPPLGSQETPRRTCYAFNGQNYKSDASPSAPKASQTTPSRASSSTPQNQSWLGRAINNVGWVGGGLQLAQYLDDQNMRGREVTAEVGPQGDSLLLRIYPEGHPGPNGAQAAFFHKDAAGNETLLPVKVQTRSDISRNYNDASYGNWVTFDPEELGRAYDLKKLSDTQREMVGLPQMSGKTFDTNNQDERDLVSNLQAQGKSGREIQAALDNLRAGKTLNWGTGALKKPAQILGRNEGVLIDETHGLQSRAPGQGLFKDVKYGEHKDPATTYLYTVDERGINVALEKTPFDTDRGNIVHSNISSQASMGGEAWFGPNNTVTINAGSGRFGDRSGITREQWDATIKLWESLGYTVNAIPFGQR